MKPIYVLDACAMLAVLAEEPSSDKVVELYLQAVLGEIILIMNKLNLLEVYYYLYKVYGIQHADHFVEEIRQSPIAINHEISDDIFKEAGRLKASYKISLADSVALAQTTVLVGMLVTSDHHEFDVIDTNENIAFFWIR